MGVFLDSNQTKPYLATIRHSNSGHKCDVANPDARVVGGGSRALLSLRFSSQSPEISFVSPKWPNEVYVAATLAIGRG